MAFEVASGKFFDDMGTSSSLAVGGRRLLPLVDLIDSIETSIFSASFRLVLLAHGLPEGNSLFAVWDSAVVSPSVAFPD